MEPEGVRFASGDRADRSPQGWKVDQCMLTWRSRSTSATMPRHGRGQCSFMLSAINSCMTVP